jgi:hypothetical protein
MCVNGSAPSIAHQPEHWCRRATIDRASLPAYREARIRHKCQGKHMHRFAFAVCLATAILAMPTLAQQPSSTTPSATEQAAPKAPKTPSPAQAAQQQKMTTCNADASQRNLKGSARQSFMSGCLSGKMNQTTLMKVCNAQASQDKLTSDDRKTYLSSCLKKS